MGALIRSLVLVSVPWSYGLFRPGGTTKTAASSRGVSRSAWASDRLPLEFNHRVTFSSALNEVKTCDRYAEYDVRRIVLGWATLGVGLG